MNTRKRIVSIVVSLAVFIGVLLGTNAYQYLKIKNDIAANLLKAINDTELENLQAFIQGIETKLNIVRDWGKSEILQSRSVVDLNRKIIPLIEHESSLSSLVMADSQGWEYFLSKQGKGYLTRETLQVGEKSDQRYQLWEDAETPGKEWLEKGDYDPTNRPWFKSDHDLESTSWTKVYTFYHTKEEGFTASVAWKNSSPRPGYTVFGMDIPLSSLKQLLLGAASKSLVNVFLVNSQNNSFLTGSSNGQGVGVEGGNSLYSVLPDCIAKWNSDGRPAREMIVFNHDGSRWFASLQPLFHQGKTFWVGVAAPEEALLSSLNKSLYSVDVVDILVALITGSLLLLYVWKTGALRSADKIVVAPIVRLMRYINEGEGARIEFKSSVRMNLKTDKLGKEIEFAWLKAVVGFLNTSGGALLLGVDDGGRIIGLEADAFENSDRCLLHVKNLIHQHIGAEFSGFIQTTLVESDDGQVVMLECQAAPEPVFLRVGKTEEFYIRSGPSSTKLSPSQMISYVMQSRV